MDYLWFRDTMKSAGVKTQDIAAAAGRDRTAVSKIINGNQSMTLDWAKAFAKVLNKDLEEVMEKAGLTDGNQPPTDTEYTPGGDVGRWQDSAADAEAVKSITRSLCGDKNSVQVWKVNSLAMSVGGYKPGDFIAVDSDLAEYCKSGDVVVAQLFDWKSSKKKTVLRRFEPPVLLADSADPDMGRVHVVDGNNVVIRGKVIASWRRPGAR
jgi:SOS-response transcriptional repressor LexA